MSAIDDLPTPERGSRAPLFLPTRPRSRNSDAPIGTVEDRVAQLERSASAVRRSLLALLGGVATSLGAVLIWALNAREAAGYERARRQEIERAIERLDRRLEALGPVLYRLQADDRPITYAPSPAAPAAPPARKEPAPP